MVNTTIFQVRNIRTLHQPTIVHGVLFLLTISTIHLGNIGK
jgi:hypothetical protein